MKATATVVFAALSGLCLHAQTTTIQRSIIRGTLSSITEAAQPVPEALTKIFSNLRPAGSAYDPNDAFIVEGPAAGSFPASIGLPFKPTANAHVQQLRAAVQYNGSGANQVNLSLYSDASGAPGSVLAGPVTVTGLPSSFSCCKLAIANLPASVAVTSGTQYWIVADTPSSGTGNDFFGTWQFIPPSTKLMVGVNLGIGWNAFGSPIEEPAGAAYGTIP